MNDAIVYIYTLDEAYTVYSSVKILMELLSKLPRSKILYIYRTLSKIKILKCAIRIGIYRCYTRMPFFENIISSKCINEADFQNFSHPKISGFTASNVGARSETHICSLTCVYSS